MVLTCVVIFPKVPQMNINKPINYLGHAINLKDVSKILTSQTNRCSMLFSSNFYCKFLNKKKYVALNETIKYLHLFNRAKIGPTILGLKSCHVTWYL